jgi:hypothetical protein
MQTLGRVAIVGGSMAVSLVNMLMFSGVGEMAEATKIAVYTDIYQMALLIPVILALGVILAAVLKRQSARQLRRHGVHPDEWLAS